MDDLVPCEPDNNCNIYYGIKYFKGKPSRLVELKITLNFLTLKNLFTFNNESNNWIDGSYLGEEVYFNKEPVTFPENIMYEGVNMDEIITKFDQTTFFNFHFIDQSLKYYIQIIPSENIKSEVNGLSESGVDLNDKIPELIDSFFPNLEEKYQDRITEILKWNKDLLDGKAILNED